MTNDCSTSLDDWYESEDTVTREEVLARGKRWQERCAGRTPEAVARSMIADATDGDADNLSSGDVVALANLLSDHLAAIALLEAEPRKPDGWAEGNWRDKMRRHRVISLYATREADSDIPVYIGAQPEVEK